MQLINGAQEATMAKKTQQAKPVTKCPHGYRSTNPVTQASGMCWNLECRWNG